MKSARQCSKTGCTSPAVATFTYDYAASTAVVGPLATTAEPHAYDLCEEHARTLTVPRGWQVIRLQTDYDPAPPSSDDLEALADAVREAAHATAPVREQPEPRGPAGDGDTRTAGWGPFSAARAGSDPRRASIRVVADDGSAS